MQDLLFLCHRIPYPPDKGDKIRAWQIFRHLARTHRIHLGCLIDEEADWEHVPKLRARCADLACFPVSRFSGPANALLHLRPGRPLSVGFFRNSKLANWVDRKLANRIDRIFVFSSSMAPYAMHARAAIRVLDMVDVDSTKWAEYAARASFPMRAIWAREARTLLGFERKAAACFDHTIFVSENEWQHFIAAAPEAIARTGWMENGVDLDYFAPTDHYTSPFAPGRYEIVFTGRMDYRPNIEAVSWFAREALPKLQRCRANIRFWIVGAEPARQVSELARLPGVQVTGRVPDTRPYLANADVVVAPLHIARGIQNKVLEAMAMARPVVTTPEAFEGVQAMPGRDILIARDVNETVQRIMEVLDGQHSGLGAAARRAVEQSHRWSAVLRRLDHLFPGISGQPSLEHLMTSAEQPA